jgi:iron(III) transport system ATP-binding protein
MAQLTLDRLGKAFGKTWAAADVSLSCADGDFLTLLGPSGCGKTTTLRLIAGFLAPTTGRILLGDRILTDVDRKILVPPERRTMGMVFQSYAVWPHMDVFGNVAYPLRRMGVSRTELERRTRQALRLVHLDGLETHPPQELSGGHQQRVALARALVMEPAVLLLDEPLSNLDANLREELRGEIKDMHERLGTTVVYVTHDQDEAMALSKRIAVMSAGRVLQVGTPAQLYEYPATPFVAKFLGIANFLPGIVEGIEGKSVRVRLRGAPAPLTFTAPNGDVTGSVIVCVRPEALAIDPSGMLRGRCLRRTYLGDRVEYLVQVGELTVRVRAGTDLKTREGADVRLTVQRGIIYPESSLTISAGRSAT